MKRRIFLVCLFYCFLETADLRSYCGCFLAICQLCFIFSRAIFMCFYHVQVLGLFGRGDPSSRFRNSSGSFCANSSHVCFCAFVLERFLTSWVTFSHLSASFLGNLSCSISEIKFDAYI